MALGEAENTASRVKLENVALKEANVGLRKKVERLQTELEGNGNEAVMAQMEVTLNELREETDELKREKLCTQGYLEESNREVLTLKKENMFLKGKAEGNTAEVIKARAELQLAQDEVGRAMKCTEDLRAEVVKERERSRKVHNEAREMIKRAESCVKERVAAAVAEAVNQVNIKNEAERAKDRAALELKREEIEKAKAESRLMVSETKKLQVSNNLVMELKTKLIKAESERDLEKLRAEKAMKAEGQALESQKKLEKILEAAQVEREEKDTRIKNLENRNCSLVRKLPCGKEDCLRDCGREHHCGVGNTGRSRHRNRRRVSEGEIPTVQNLADMAGAPLEEMQQVVDSVNLQGRRPPHPRDRSNSKSRDQKPWKVIPCPDYHYRKLCPRGNQCKNAHILYGAKQVSKGHGNGGMNYDNLRPANYNAPKLKFPQPDYHPEHPHYEWAMRLRAQSERNRAIRDANIEASRQQASGNGNGQLMGPPSVQDLPQARSSTQHQAMNSPSLTQDQASGSDPTVTQDQRFQSELYRPRSFSEVASGSVAARATIQSTMRQMSSSREQLDAMDEEWKREMDQAFNRLRFPGSAPSSSETPMTQSLESLNTPLNPRGSGM